MEITIPIAALKEIAGYLQAGMNCWYHIPTGEVLYAPDSMESLDFDEGQWRDIFNEIDKKMHESIAFEGLGSHEEYRIMESFAENEVSDPGVRSRLIHAINQRKPFMHFKSAIHYDGDYLEAWYAFRTKRYLDHLQEELDFYNSKKVENNEDEE